MNRTTVGRLFGSLGHTVLVVLLGFAALFISYLVSDPHSGTILGAAVWAVLYGALVYGLVYLFQAKLARKSLKATGVFHRPLPSAGRGAALAALVYGAILAAGVVAGSLRYVGPVPAATGGPGPLLLLLTGAMVCLAIATGEELLVRGYLFGYLREQHGLAGAAIISSVVFSLMHVVDGPRGALELLNIVAIGLVLALLRSQTGSLWAPIGFHWAWNWLDMYLVPVGDQGVEPFVATTSGAGPESDLFTTIAFVAVAVSLWIRIKKYLRSAGDVWRRDTGWVVAAWLIIAAAALGGPLPFRGVAYPVVATPAQPGHLELLSPDRAILSSASLAATQIRAPLAWQRATGRGVVVLELVRPGFEELAPDAARDLLATIAPAALCRRQAVHGRTVMGVAEEIDIVAAPDAAGWEEPALIEQVRQLVGAGKAVLVGVEGSGRLGAATRRRLTQAGAITVGSTDPASLIVDPLVWQEPADLYAPVGTRPREAAALVATGVAALSPEALAGDNPTGAVRERLIAGSITRWQAVNVHTGDVDESLYQVDSSGSYQAVRFLNRGPAVYRALDAARSVGVELTVSWEVNALNAEPAWQLARGQGVKAAVVAEGFALQRPALQNRVAGRTGFCARPWEEYRSPQGTSTAEAVAGVAPDAELLTVLVEEGDQTERFPSAIRWAVEQGAALVAIPFGSGMNSPAASAAIDFAVSQGTVVVWPDYGGENPAVIRPSLPGFAPPPGSAPIMGLASWSREYPLTGLDCTPEVVGQIAGLVALAAQVAPELEGREIEELLQATGTREVEWVIPDALRFVEAALAMER